MYILKVKGKSSIPDYVQIRDEKFVLIGYFKTTSLDKSLVREGYENPEKLIEFIDRLPYGTIKKYEV